MSKSTVKRRIRNSPCGCFYCIGHDKPTRAQQVRAWRKDWSL